MCWIGAASAVGRGVSVGGGCAVKTAGLSDAAAAAGLVVRTALCGSGAGAVSWLGAAARASAWSRAGS